ncbi:DNA-3-methyladenine glycosylase 2 family protein [Oleiharenicola lentus]|jgi:3-methyladenine DNA glycosylase/8-oxoguanine DNA glycosylase|uniref:DNA-3-methyladenine glycosylase II n=1 Tax=Oleiharenicola lentus TaxID=2508720 RepID=A0A4Q1CBY1_9BACT|nr:DNA-3-methyladenine glycosylase [Oleiharenicola lentus]RXK56446.1 DNA-3-methyladenine glycosylase 2 family protein [Oleiharenicola lentus]
MRQRFQFDPVDAVAHLRATDPVMATLTKRVGPFALKLTPSHSLFEALLRSIVYQQLHGKAAATIHGRVLAQLRQHGGPIPEALIRVSDEALRTAGLSRAKLLAVRDLSAKCLAGTVPSLKDAGRLTDAELEERLTEVRGIGPWTVHMLLIFTLGRADVMPTGDFAIRLAFKQLYRKRIDPSPAVILRHARCWQPYRSVASWYLWRHLDTP